MYTDSCPLATKDIGVNLANRQKAIRVAGYGPANPQLPNNEFWKAKAQMWNESVTTARSMLCGNCAAFNIKPQMIACIKTGLGPQGDPEATIGAGQLGYCQMFHFKCASKRTCNAWVVGGPLK